MVSIASRWLINNASTYNVSNQQIVLAGDSAGANLATVLSQRSRGVAAPKPWKQILIYPTTDSRLQHPSINKFGKNYFLSKRQIQWFVDNYKHTDADVINPEMSPLLIDDLSQQPPTYLCVAGLDPLKDEGIAYAKKLQESGVGVQFRSFSEVIHGFINMPRIMPRATRILMADIQKFLGTVEA